MSGQDYSVAVKLTLVENITRGTLMMAKNFAALDKQAMMFQARLSALRSQAALGAGIVAFGTALAAPLIAATTQAGKLQQQLKMVQIATNASTAQIDNFHTAISSIALSSIFNVTEVAKIARILSTAGNFNVAQVQELTPQFVKFAQTQQLLKGTAPEKSTDQAIKLAEITGNFDPKSIEVSLNALTKLSFVMPGSIDKVLGAFKYMEGTMKNVMGMSDENSLMLVAFLQRMGMEGTRAGTQLINFVSRTIPQVFGSGLWEGKSLPNLQAMGMLDAKGIPQIFSNGKVDPMKLFHSLGSFITKDFATMPEASARTDIMRKFQQTFGSTGTRLAALLTTPQAIKQFEEIQAAYKRRPDLDTLSEGIDDLLSKQLPQTKSGLQTLFADLGYALLPDAVRGLKYFNEQLLRVDQWVNKNQGIVRAIEEITLAISGLSIVGGVLLLIKVGISGLLLPFQFLSTLLPIFGSAIGAVEFPLLLVIGAAGLVGVALYALYRNWDIAKAKIQELYAAFQNTTAYKVIISAMTGLNKALHMLGDSINYIYHAASNAYNNFIKAHPTAKKVISTASHAISPAIVPLPLQIAQAVIHHFFPQKQSEKPIVVAAGVKHIGMQKTNQANNMNQPIHVHVNMDGRKVAHAVANHIYSSATSMPNTASQFDTNLSPMPYIANSVGVTR